MYIYRGYMGIYGFFSGDIRDVYMCIYIYMGVMWGYIGFRVSQN